MRIIARLGAISLFLAACSSSDYVVVKLTADPGLPAVVQLQISANDGLSQANALVPNTPDPSGIAFPKSCVIAVPHTGTLSVTVQGMDATGTVVARGASPTAVTSSVQTVQVDLSALCSSAADCDPDGVCSGAVICGDAGSCVPGDNTVAVDATACGHDGGHCYSGTCDPTSCGDGIVEVGEACDDGAQNGTAGSTCTALCQFARCGDGVLNLDPLPDGGVFQELCDWGQPGDAGAVLTDGGNSDTLSNHCRTNCLPPRCGDAVVDTGERCDLGPLSPAGSSGNGAGVGCNATCSLLEQVTTLAGDGNPGFQNGAGAQAEFKFPNAIALLGGTAYIADEFNDLIRTIDLASGSVGTLAGQLGVEMTQDGPPATNATDAPKSIAVFGAQLVVAEATDVRTLGLDGTLTTLAGSSAVELSDGPFADAGFAEIYGVTWNGTDLFVTDQALGIRRLDLATRTVSSYLFASDGGGLSLNPTEVTGILAADGGLLYVADGQNCDLLSFDPASGDFQYLTGNAGGCGFVDGVGFAAKLNSPYGLCTDGVSLYVADSYNGAIRQVVLASGAVTTVAGNGSQATSPVNGTGRAATFAQPVGCAFDPVSGDLLVVDFQGSQVRRIH